MKYVQVSGRRETVVPVLPCASHASPESSKTTYAKTRTVTPSQLSSARMEFDLIARKLMSFIFSNREKRLRDG